MPEDLAGVGVAPAAFTGVSEGLSSEEEVALGAVDSDFPEVGDLVGEDRAASAA